MLIKCQCDKNELNIQTKKFLNTAKKDEFLKAKRKMIKKIKNAEIIDKVINQIYK